MILKQLPQIIGELNTLGIALKSLDAMNFGAVGVNLANVEAYRTALKGLSVEQSVFALASKGATEEQIRQILVTDQAKLKDVEAAMAKAGLTTATKALNAEELIALATKKGISAERAKEIASALGLIATEKGQIVSKKQLTVATLQQVGATDAEITAILGLNAAETANIGITNVLTASFAKLWAVITAHPIGAILTAIGVVAVGAVAAYNKWGDTLENTKEKLSDLKSECQKISSDLQAVNSELETTQQRLEELEGKDTLTFTEKEEYDNLVKINNELQRKIDLLELEEKNKRKEQNKTFVSAMEKDTENPFEHEVNPDGKKPAGQYSISDEYLTSETGYIEAQFEIRDQLLEDLANAETEKEKERIQKRIDEIEKYLNDKNDEWKNVSDGISYIENPTTEDDKAVNEWLDYIADFQDRMAIAMSKDDASSNAQYKTNTFNRVVDNWQFDDTVQGLQDLGKEGKVTAEMLDDPKYDEFINKLVFLGVIDSADNLEDVALAFNSVATSAENAADSASQYGNEITVLNFSDVFNAKDFADTKQSLLDLAKAGELTPYTLSSTKEYKTLLDQTGLTAEQVYKKIMKVAQADMTDADWQTTLTHARSQITNIQSALDELKENGESSTFVDTIISDYPQLLGYLGNEAEMREQLKALQEEQEDVANKAYQQLVEDSQVYYNTLKTKEAEKLNVANNTINSIIGGNKQLVDVLGKNYKIDLNNYKSIADAKAKLETELIKNSASAWSKFYTVQVNASTGLAEVLGSSTTVPSEYMGSDGDYGKAVSKMVKEQNQQKKNAQDAADAYNTAIASLNNVVKSTSISTGTGGGSGSGAGSATKSTTKFSQAIDWCAQTLSKLSKTIDLYSAKLENNTNSVKTQIKYYKQLLTAQNNVVKGYAKTESKYKSQYNKALKKLSASDQKKVKNGTYTIEQFSGKAKSGSTSKEEKRYNNIQSALEARDNYLDSQTDLVNAKNQLQEFAEALASLRWENATEQVEKLNGELELLDLKLSNANGYKAKNEIVDQQLKVQKQIVNKQKSAISNTQNDADVYYAKISAKNKKNKNADGTIKTAGVTNQTQLKYIKIYNAYVRQLAEETLELQKAEEEYQSAVNESAITKAENVKAEYDNKISLIDAKENRLNSEIALAEAKGQVASAEYYKLLNANSDERMAQLKEEKTELESQLATLEPYSDAWYEVKQATIEVDEAIAEETVNAVENINKQIEAIEALTKAKNDYLSSAIGTYDWLESLTDTDDYYNEDGSFSDKGMAIVKSKIDKVKLYKQQAKNVQGDIDSLDAMYANNKDDAEYLNKRIELTEDLQNVTKSMYDEQQSLHDMYIDGLKEESEALQELIDKKMESLNASKAEADYQKSIANKVKNITDLEKQLAMLEGDNSEEARAKRQKVQVQLEEAQQDLEDTQYDKYLERLENSLGDLQDRFDAVIEKLDKQGAIPSIEELSTLVDSNSASVVNGVDKIIKDAGLDSLLGEKGIGYLNDATTNLLTSPVSEVSTKIDTVNTWLGNIYDATVGSTTNKDNDSNNVNPTTSTSQTSSVTGGITGTIGVDQLPTPSTELTTKMNSQVSLTQRKAKEFINQNATKAKKKQSEYGILNKKIYDITGGKILSKENRVKLAELLGIGDADNSGDITGAEAKKIVALLENAGFANGGIVEAVRKNGDDGLATLKVGESVLTPVQTTAFTKLAENIVPFNNLIGDIVERPNIPTVDRGASMSSTSIDNINVEFSLPNVTDKESFKDWLQNDGWINRYFDSMITNKTVGGNKRFGANRL